MAEFTIHTADTAPDDSEDLLDAVETNMGIIPSVLGVMAENPAMLEGYMKLAAIFTKAGFTPLEQQIVLITTSVENDCHFCVAAHSFSSEKSKLDMAVINDLRDNKPLADARLEALRTFTKQTVLQRGFVCDAQVDNFIDAGWDRAAVLGVILGVALKALSNYTNHVAETPVNDVFKDYTWTPPKREASAEAR